MTKKKRTPLRVWHARRGMPWDELARRAGVGIATVMRAAAGHPLGSLAARAISQETGIPIDRLMAPPERWEGDEEPAESPPRPVAPPPPPPPPPPSEPADPEVEADPEPPMRAGHYPLATRGRILAEAEYATDVAVAARYRIHPTSLRNWRAAMLTQPECLRAYKRAMRQMEDLFLADAARAFTALTRRLTDLAPSMTPDEVTSALERVGDVLIQARGLGRAIDGDGDDGIAQIDREGAAHPTDPESAGPSPVH